MGLQDSLDVGLAGNGNRVIKLVDINAIEVM